MSVGNGLADQRGDARGSPDADHGPDASPHAGPDANYNANADPECHADAGPDGPVQLPDEHADGVPLKRRCRRGQPGERRDYGIADPVPER